MTHYCDTTNGTFPDLVMRITLTRKIQYHLLQTFLPSSLFVILGRTFESSSLRLHRFHLYVGYLSLYIPPDSIPGRIAIAMTTILTLTAMFSGVRGSVPQVSYISYLDIWMVICLIFVNAFMFEFVLVVHLISIDMEIFSQVVERKCRVLFPILFIIFNVLYWSLVFTI